MEQFQIRFFIVQMPQQKIKGNHTATLHTLYFYSRQELTVQESFDTHLRCLLKWGIHFLHI